MWVVAESAFGGCWYRWSEKVALAGDGELREGEQFPEGDAEVAVEEIWSTVQVENLLRKKRCCGARGHFAAE